MSDDNIIYFENYLHLPVRRDTNTMGVPPDLKAKPMNIIRLLVVSITKNDNETARDCFQLLYDHYQDVEIDKIPVPAGMAEQIDTLDSLTLFEWLERTVGRGQPQ